MAKVTAPLLSLEAHGHLAQRLTYSQRRKTSVVRIQRAQKDKKSSAQLAVRATFLSAIADWKALTTPEKNVYNHRALTRNMTGFNLFVHEFVGGGGGGFTPVPGYVGWWKLDNDALDSSGNGYDGTIEGSPSFTSDVPAVAFADPYSLTFDGISDDILGVNIPEINDNAKSFSVSWWMKSSNGSQTANAILTYNQGSLDPNNNWYIMLKTTLTIGGFYDTGEYNTGIAATDGAWHNFILVKTPTLLTLYKDGVSVWTQTPGSPHADYSASDWLGFALPGNVSRYDGILDDIRIYDFELDLTQIGLISSGNG